MTRARAEAGSGKEKLPPAHIPVLIAGAGPCGLMLANELSRYGIKAAVIDKKSSTAFDPKANATQARTMEYYRRLGLADEIRALGLPPDFPTDIAYYTRVFGHELARFELPSAREAQARARISQGDWSTAELPHRCAQKYIEKVLRAAVDRAPGVTLHFNWALKSFTDHGGHVTAEIEAVDGSAAQTVDCDYLIGADGANSLIRRTLGIDYAGEKGKVRDFFGGPMYAVYLNAKDFYALAPHKPAWMNVTVNTDRRAIVVAVDGKGEFAFHTQLRAHESQDGLSDKDARAMFQAAIGAEIDTEILSTGTWTAGHALVAESYGAGRVLLGGDAAHLFTPTGGLGYNTAVEDAVNLAWKLAHVIKGVSPAALLDTYESERRKLALRNTGYARQFADNLGLFKPGPAIERDDAAGNTARAQASDHLNAHARAEFNIPGITFGGRYDGSPIIVADGTAPPPDAANSYQPTACPGGRPPHLWLDETTSLYDGFGAGWTLLRLGPQPVSAGNFVKSAKTLGLDLLVMDVPGDDARDLYQTDLALIRPDQIVAWRGDSDDEVDAVLAQAAGARALSEPGKR